MRRRRRRIGRDSRGSGCAVLLVWGFWGGRGLTKGLGFWAWARGESELEVNGVAVVEVRRVEMTLRERVMVLVRYMAEREVGSYRLLFEKKK